LAVGDWRSGAQSEMRSRERVVIFLPRMEELSATSLFAHYLDAKERGENPDFDALCAAHPEFAATLRERRAEHLRMEAVLDREKTILSAASAILGSAGGRLRRRVYRYPSRGIPTRERLRALRRTRQRLVVVSRRLRELLRSPASRRRTALSGCRKLLHPRLARRQRHHPRLACTAGEPQPERGDVPRRRSRRPTRQESRPVSVATSTAAS
jgi:hypothetical protein